MRETGRGTHADAGATGCLWPGLHIGSCYSKIRPVAVFFMGASWRKQQTDWLSLAKKFKLILNRQAQAVLHHNVPA